MASFVVNGGTALSGDVCISGSKNAALPILFATLIARGENEIYNLPSITDVAVALDILRGFGAKISCSGNLTLIDTEKLEYALPSEKNVAAIRASTYLIGSCLSRFGISDIMHFGGCNFSKRPIDFHIEAAEAFGAVLSGDTLYNSNPKAAEYTVKKRSVGATVNALLLAAGTSGRSKIYGAAEEPHIEALIAFLSSAGAQISHKNGEITVTGGALHSGRAAISADMIEAGTYMLASLATGGRTRIFGAPINELSALLDTLSEAGAKYEIGDGFLLTKAPPNKPINITTAPYPGFPTDLQPLMAPLLAKRLGGSICDTVWQGRFGYLRELSRFGVLSEIKGDRAEIFSSSISAANASATDLRGGAAALICALMAKGESKISGAELVLRGYERPIEKLRSLGAKIELIR